MIWLSYTFFKISIKNVNMSSISVKQNNNIEIINKFKKKKIKKKKQHDSKNIKNYKKQKQKLTTINIHLILQQAATNAHVTMATSKHPIMINATKAPPKRNKK